MPDIDWTDRVVRYRMERLARYAVTSGELTKYVMAAKRYRKSPHRYPKPKSTEAVRAYNALRKHKARQRGKQNEIRQKVTLSRDCFDSTGGKGIVKDAT